MARRRMIDPSIWDDESVGSLSGDAFRLFIGCISLADDGGKLEGSAKRLRAAIFCYQEEVTTADVQRYLSEIESSLRSFKRYSVDGREYIKLLRWNDYQTINRPYPSKLPDPPTNNSVNDHGTLTESSLPSTRRSTSTEEVNIPTLTDSQTSELAKGIEQYIPGINPLKLTKYKELAAEFSVRAVLGCFEQLKIEDNWKLMKPSFITGMLKKRAANGEIEELEELIEPKPSERPSLTFEDQFPDYAARIRRFRGEAALGTA